MTAASLASTPSTTASDLELLDAWQAGDRRAGHLLLRRCRPAVQRFFAQRVAADAEDLTQQTLLACAESKGRIHTRAGVHGFLFAVARNVLGKHFRRQRRHGERRRLGVDALHDPSPSTSALVAHHQERRALLDALDRLAPEHRRVLELYYWDRRTSAAIARELGLPHGTARTRIRRARLLLQALLEHHPRPAEHPRGDAYTRAGEGMPGAWSPTPGARAGSHGA